jgi:hypothetical protein
LHRIRLARFLNYWALIHDHVVLDGPLLIQIGLGLQNINGQEELSELAKLEHQVKEQD